MKKLTTVGLMFVLALGFLQFAQAQDFPKVDKSPMDMAYYPSRAAFRAFEEKPEDKMANEPVIRLIYSRPMKKGRKVFGELEKYGNVWRVGANETTEIQFFQPVTIGDTRFQEGRYTVYALINEGEWTFHFSTDLDGWGHYAYKPDETGVGTITVKTEKTKDTVEALSIMFEKAEDGAHMIVAWDDTMARVPIQF